MSPEFAILIFAAKVWTSLTTFLKSGDPALVFHPGKANFRNGQRRILKRFH